MEEGSDSAMTVEYIVECKESGRWVPYASYTSETFAQNALRKLRSRSNTRYRLVKVTTEMVDDGEASE